MFQKHRMKIDFFLVSNLRKTCLRDNTYRGLRINTHAYTRIHVDHVYNT